MSKLKFQFNGNTFLTFKKAEGSNLFYKIIHSILRLADKFEVFISILFLFQIIYYLIFWPNELSLILPLAYIFLMLVIHFIKYFYRLNTPIKIFKLDITLIFFVTLATLASLIPYFISIYSGNNSGANNFIINNTLNLGVFSSFSYIILLFFSYFFVTSLIKFVGSNNYLTILLISLLGIVTLFFVKLEKFEYIDLIISLIFIFLTLTFSNLKNIKDLAIKIYRKIRKKSSSLKINSFDIFYILLIIILDILLLLALVLVNFEVVNIDNSLFLAEFSKIGEQVLNSSAYELIFGGQNVRNSDNFLLGFIKSYGLIIGIFFLSVNIILISNLLNLFGKKNIRGKIEVLLLFLTFFSLFLSFVVFKMPIHFLILFWTVLSFILSYLSAEDKNYLEQDKHDIAELKKFKRWKIIETIRMITAFVIFPILLSWGYSSLLMLT